MTLSGAALAAAIAESSAAAFVPAALVTATVQVQRLVGLASAAGIPPKIAALMEGVMKSMAMVKAKKLMAITVIALGTIGLGVGGYQLPAEEPATSEEAAPKPATRTAETKPVAVPSGPALTPALVSVISSGQIVVKRGGRSYVATPVKKQGVMGYEYRRVTTVGMQVFDPETVAVFDHRGRKMPVKKLAALLKKESPAFVVQGNEEPDPMVFQLLNEKAVIVQIPVVTVPSAPLALPAVPPPAPLALPPTPTAPLPAQPPAPVVPQPAPPLPPATSERPSAPAPALGPIYFAGKATPGRYHIVFGRALEVAGSFFEIADAKIFEGRIETEPRPSPPVTSRDREYRCRALIQVNPADTDGYLVSVRVLIEARDARSKTSEWKRIGGTRSSNNVCCGSLRNMRGGWRYPGRRSRQRLIPQRRLCRRRPLHPPRRYRRFLHGLCRFQRRRNPLHRKRCRCGR